MLRSYAARTAWSERKVRPPLDSPTYTPHVVRTMIIFLKLLLAAATGFILLTL